MLRQAQAPTICTSYITGRGWAAMHNRDVRARRQMPPRAKLRHSLTTPAGGWTRKRRMRETGRRRAGNKWIDSPCGRLSSFQIRTASCEEYFVFGTRVKGNRPKWNGDEAAMTTAAGRHTQTHDRPTHHHERSNHRFFCIFHEAVVLPVIYATGLCSVCRVVYPSRGMNSCKSQGRGETFREGGAIADICMLILLSMPLSSLHVRRSSR